MDGLYRQKEEARKSKLIEQFNKGKEFDFVNDFSSSDYECVSDEELEHLMKQDQHKNYNFNKLKGRMSAMDQRNSSAKKQGRRGGQQKTQKRET